MSDPMPHAALDSTPTSIRETTGNYRKPKYKYGKLWETMENYGKLWKTTGNYRSFLYGHSGFPVVFRSFP